MPVPTTLVPGALRQIETPDANPGPAERQPIASISFAIPLTELYNIFQTGIRDFAKELKTRYRAVI